MTRTIGICKRLIVLISSTVDFDRVCSEGFVSMDLIEDDVVNFEDYADLMIHWLEEVLWPN